MKEKVHLGLSNLVLQFGTCRIKRRYENSILEASIKPDITNKQKIEENLLSAPFVLYKWWMDHSIRAEDLAIICIQEAEKAYRIRRSYWTQYLGYAFHFITDRATPYHSPNKVTQIIDSMKEQYEEDKKLRGYNVKNQLFIELLDIGTKFFSKAVNLKIDHNEFEELCEQKWSSCIGLITEIFTILKNSYSSIVTLDLIERELENLHEKYKDISLRWINSSNNYAKYMTKIAFVMDLACRFVLIK